MVSSNFELVHLITNFVSRVFPVLFVLAVFDLIVGLLPKANVRQSHLA